VPIQNTSKIVLDSSAWLEYFSGTEKGKHVRKLITPHTTVLVTGMIVAEVLSKFLRLGLPTNEVLGNMQMTGALFPFDFELAEQTAHIYHNQRAKNSKFGIVDAHIVAIGLLGKAKVITCDNEFSGLPNTLVVR
jgi:PIN domain nuclease of toxin-antitoxin system